MRPWGDYDYARDFKQASVWDLRRYGFELATGDRGRPAQRRDVPRRGRPVHLHPLRVLRLTSGPIPGTPGWVEALQWYRTRTRVHGASVSEAGSRLVASDQSVGERDEKRTEDGRPPGGPGCPVPGHRRRSWAAPPGSSSGSGSPSCSAEAPTGSATSSRSRRPRAKPVTREELPEVYAIVEELTSAAGMPMPTIYVADEAQPNAFATGRNPHHAAVVRDPGHPPGARPRRAARRPRPRALAREEPRHPHRIGRGGGRARRSRSWRGSRSGVRCSAAVAVATATTRSARC